MNVKITIADVAKKADVSIATVSRLLNNKNNVKPETRKKVTDAMEELGFVDKVRGKLSDSKSKNLLVCFPDFSNPFFGLIIDGIQSAARQDGYTVLFVQDNAEMPANFERLLKTNSIAGIIMLSHVSNSNFLNDLMYRCPVVTCSEYTDNSVVSCVAIDDKKASINAVNYLISTGCRNISLFNCSLKFNYAKRRANGFEHAMNSAQLKINPNWQVTVPSVDYKLAHSYALHLLSQKERPDGIFACSDVFAVAIINAAKRLGISVPDELSIVGFDNVDLSTISTPSITTIEQPSYQLGFQACSLLLEKINDNDVATKHIFLDTELIVRDSTKLS